MNSIYTLCLLVRKHHPRESSIRWKSKSLTKAYTKQNIMTVPYVCNEEFRRPNRAYELMKKNCVWFSIATHLRVRERERKKRGKDVRKKRALPNNELHCEKCLNFFIISLFFFNILHTMFKCFRRVHLYRMRTNLYWSYCTVEHDERDRVKSTSVIPIVARYLFGAKIRLFESIWYGHCWQWFIGKTGK